MLILGLDTATRRVGVVLANEQGMLARVELGGTAEGNLAMRADAWPKILEFLDETLKP